MILFLFRKRYPVNIRGLKALVNPTLCRIWLPTARECEEVLQREQAKLWCGINPNLDIRLKG